MDPAARCADCRYLCALDNSCRVNAPTAFPVQTGASQVGSVALFPIVRPEWWCGRFERDTRPLDDRGDA